MPNGGFGLAFSSILDAQDSRGASDGRRASTKADALEARLDRLAMLCEALWTLVRDELKLTDEALLDRINAIDLTDGRLDGKADRGSALTCHACHRTVSRRFAKCMYCGAVLAHDPFG